MDNVVLLLSLLSVYLCVTGTSYKFRVLAVNVLGASPPSAGSKAYAVMGSSQTNPRPVDGPYITYSEAINETTIILKWTVSILPFSHPSHVWCLTYVFCLHFLYEVTILGVDTNLISLIFTYIFMYMNCS